MSAQPCGCDPTHKPHPWVCEWHRQEGQLASMESNGQDFVKNPGNGAQQSFATGATRSSDRDKFDFEGHIAPEVLAYYASYMHKHRVQRDGNIRASDNWQQGIPRYRFVKSLIRHVFEFWRMWRGNAVRNPDNGQLFTFGDVLCAILFNTMGLIFEMQRRNPGMLDRMELSQTERGALELEDKPKDVQLGMKRPEQEPIATPARQFASDRKCVGADGCIFVSGCPGDCSLGAKAALERQAAQQSDRAQVVSKVVRAGHDCRYDDPPALGGEPDARGVR